MSHHQIEMIIAVAAFKTGQNATDHIQHARALLAAEQQWLNKQLLTLDAIEAAKCDTRMNQNDEQ